jgi:hypothetical protein
MKHTPTPWEFRDNGSDNGLDPCFCVVGEPREYGLVDHFATENAEHIVKCVNAHDEIVAALKAYADICEDDDVYPGLNETARDILIKVEGGAK